jgi:two-component system, OmpR family, phosphate regulon response regulator PhoB
MASDLVVVQRDRTEVFEALQRRRWPSSTRLIWDRRVRDRRVILQDVLNERRSGERRADPGPGWQHDGFVVAARSQSDLPPVGALRRPPLVLVADDEPALRDVLCEVLNAAGYRTQIAADGAEVIERVRSERPDLILLDVMMPQMDGYTALSRLNGAPLTSRAPVIVLTGRPEPIYGTLSAGVGAVTHLTKPITPADLVEAVRQALTRSPIANEHPYRRQLGLVATGASSSD